MLAVSKSPEVKANVAAENAVAALEAVERANATAELVTMADLYEQHQQATEAAYKAGHVTCEIEDRVRAHVNSVAPAVMITRHDVFSLGLSHHEAGKKAHSGTAKYLEEWLVHVATSGRTGHMARAKQIIDAVRNHRIAWEQTSKRLGYDAAVAAETEAWNRLTQVEDTIIRRRAHTLDDLKIKARIAIKQFAPDDAADQDWPDAVALACLRDVLELTQ